MEELRLATQEIETGCCGNCEGCGKVHVRIFSGHDLPTLELTERVEYLFQQFQIPHKMISTSDPEAAAKSGIKALPALMFDYELIAEGEVPSFETLYKGLMDRFIRHIGLYQLGKISVPVDMSPESGNALRFAAGLAATTGSKLEVVHVMDSIFEGVKGSGSGFLGGYSKTMEEELKGFIGTELDDTNLEVSSKVLFGQAATMLKIYSQDTDLIIIGANGRNHIGRRWFGSVSAEVSLAAHCPVMLIPDNATWNPLHDIVYAADFESLQPVQMIQADAFARRTGAKMHLVHASTDDKGQEQELDEKLKIISNLLPEMPKIQKVYGDSVLESLYEYTQEHKADLLVFVAHERRYWESLLHKSVTSEALADAKMPVLIIHDTAGSAN